MLPLASAALLLNPTWRREAIEGGLALSDAVAGTVFGGSPLAPVFADREMTPFERYPLNSYLTHDPEIDLGEWRLSVSGLVRNPGEYTPAAEDGYSSVMLLVLLGSITGFALYKPVHLSWLVDAIGGFRMVRAWHFAAMCGVLAFIPGHLVMVALHGWRNLVSMWTGELRESGIRNRESGCRRGLAFCLAQTCVLIPAS